MPRQYRTSRNFDRILDKLQKKNKQLYESLFKKMNEILNVNNVEHYKNLRYSLKDFKRAHVGSFVLIFRYDSQNDIIFFTDFDHHDNIYRKKFL
jgi:YafQ family addiction module toxin component